jgi:hypothetical protein
MYKQKIDKTFIDNLRLSFSIIQWAFDKKVQKEIVSEELTHKYLLRNFSIDESIYKYYHLPTSRLLSDSEFQEMQTHGFAGGKETALSPYSFIIYGAYYSRSDLYTKLLGLVCGERVTNGEGKEIKDFSDLIPYFKEYAKGFENGFNEFDNSQVKPYLTILAEKHDYVNKVFDFVTKNILFTHSWAYSSTGFTINVKSIKPILGEIANAFKDGQKQGYFYKAWSVIFSNNELFAPLFRENLNTLSTKPPENYPAKFYALYHWLKIEMGTENQFAKNDSDQFIKSDIVAFANEKYPNCSLQGFYRAFINLDITNRTTIANSFGNGYKEKLIALSNNDNRLVTYLKNYPN